MHLCHQNSPSQPLSLCHRPSVLSSNPEHQLPQEWSRERHFEKLNRWVLISQSKMRADLWSQVCKGSALLENSMPTPWECSGMARTRRRGGRLFCEPSTIKCLRSSRKINRDKLCGASRVKAHSSVSPSIFSTSFLVFQNFLSHIHVLMGLSFHKFLVIIAFFFV